MRSHPFSTSSALPQILALAVILTGTAGIANKALADEQATPPPPPEWADAIKHYGHAEAGVAFNPASPSNNENIGDLFTDKSNQLQLNQLAYTVERPIDSTSSKLDLGFKVQAMFGSDARYTHSLAEFDHLVHSKYQLDVVEAHVDAHVPVLTAGGIDIKAGQLVSPMGAEVIDATGNSLYSHSYIFNFGTPLKNTGILTISHVSPLLDLYAGLDTGVNGGITADGDMNHEVKGQFGFGLNMLGGNLTVLALSHIGAENSPKIIPGGGLRYLNDVTTTYKVNDKLTLTNDLNYIEDDGAHAIGYGMAQYATYALNDKWTLIGRGEVWRDNSGFFVSADPAYFDAANAQRGLTNTALAVPRTTYGALTLGANYKPEVPKAIEGFVIRPELRIDQSLNGSKPFNVGKDSTSFTPAVDVVVPF